MEIRPIKSEADYKETLKEIESLMMAEENSPEGDRLDVLVTLVEAYERLHYPIDFPDPVEAIKFRMEQQGLTVRDLIPVIGRKNRVYEILAGKRPLTLRMIEGLHNSFSIPAESLLKNSARRNDQPASGQSQSVGAQQVAAVDHPKRCRALGSLRASRSGGN